MGIYAALLFFLLSPGVLFRFPLKNPMIVLGVHAVLFAIIYQLTHKAVYRQIYGKEGFANAGSIFTTIAYIIIFIIAILMGFSAFLNRNKNGATVNTQKKNSSSNNSSSGSSNKGNSGNSIKHNNATTQPQQTQQRNNATAANTTTQQRNKTNA